MSRKLLISFELHSPSRNYLIVEKAIAALGEGVRVHTYFWYLVSSMTAAEAAARLWEVMDERDSVLVIDAPEQQVGWHHIPQDVSTFIKARVRQGEQRADETLAPVSAIAAMPRRLTPVRLQHSRLADNRGQATRADPTGAKVSGG